MNQPFNGKIEPIQAQADQEEKAINKPQVLFLIIFAVFVALDQLTKTWASFELTMYQPVRIFGDWLRLVLVHNQGLIWSLPIKSFLSYYVLPIIGIIFILYLAIKTKSNYLGIAYGFIASGAIGNLIDRIRLGYVIDFIDMGIKNTRWATYNIADVAIVIGLIMIIAKELFKSNKKREPKEDIKYETKSLS